MWSSRRLFLLAGCALGACGFQPVNGPGGTGAALRDSIRVAAPTTREAFLLVQRLEERLGRPGDPTYELDLDLRLQEQGLGVDEDSDVQRFNLIGQVQFALRDLRTGQIATSGAVDNFTGYSATGTTVAAAAAERDAQERLMVILADQVVQRLQATPLPA